MRVAVLFGGSSEERDVSIASAAQIIPALRRRGFEVLAVDTAYGSIAAQDEERVLSRAVGVEPPAGAELEQIYAERNVLRLPSTVAGVDLVFVALHGGFGEDGRLQALLDLAGVPYTGSGALASGLAMDKDVSKTLVRAGGVRTPDWLIGETDPRRIVGELGLPVVVKPTAQGSIVGLTIARDVTDLPEAYERALQHGTVMHEQFVFGRELTVGVLDGRPLAVGEIMLPMDDAFSYEDKYQAGPVVEIFPADVPLSVSRVAKKSAVTAHHLLRLDGYSRSDFRLDLEGRLWFIETNSLPEMTATSLLPQSAAAVGIDYDELCDRICRLALGTG